MFTNLYSLLYAYYGNLKWWPSETDDETVKSHYETIYGKSVSIDHVPNPERYGVANIMNGLVKKVVEKPKHPESKYALAAFYVFKRDVMNLIDGPELTPAINQHIIEGNEVLPFKIRRSDWASIGNSDDYYKVLRRTYNFCTRIISS